MVRLPKPFMFLLICFFVGMTQTDLHAQPNKSSIDDIVITGDYRGISIIDLLAHLKNKYPVMFYFNPEEIPAYEVNLQFREAPFYEALNDILSGTGLVYAPLQPGEVVIVPKQSLNKEYAESLKKKWEDGTFRWPEYGGSRELPLQYGTPGNAKAGAKITFSGVVRDEKTGEPITGATLLARGSQRGTATDAQGKFLLEFTPGEYTIDVQYIGYESLVIQLSIYAKGEAGLEMAAAAFNLEEVIIKAKADDSNVRSTQIGVENLSVKTIKQLSSLLGEADVLKSLETLAGVSTVGEGASGVNVRGGNIDQNLIMQDGAPILNSSHALGFFSAFNPDVIGSVSLYKGSIPAQFGGRVSSVLDVQLRDGNYQQWSASGGIGLAFGRLTIEGPIIRDRLSVIAGGRLSYSDWMLRTVRTPNVKRSAVAFSDYTIKVSQKIGTKHLLSLSGYQSNDYFRYSNEFGYAWSTQLLTASWNYLISDRLSAGVKLIGGDYKSHLFEPTGGEAFDLTGGIRYYSGKASVFYQQSATLQLTSGIEWNRYEPKPEEVSPKGENSTIAPKTVDKDLGEEYGAFVNGEWTINPRISVSGGLRYSFYRQLGPRSVYLYEEGLPVEPSNTIDTVLYASGKTIQTYGGIEPRISFKYELGRDRSVKLSYNRLYQYLHLVSNTAAATPVDLWQVSTLHIAPQSANVYSMGYFQNFRQTLWQFSIELYYKQLENLLTYKELPQLLLNEQLETALLPAKGKAYGFEVSVKKTSGKWSGQLAYTFSRSFLRTHSAFPWENINEAKWFPANFDQPHQINLVLRNQMSPVHSITFNFTFRTGRPFTIPTANYLVDGVVITHYSPRNEGRLPAYHRLDFSFSSDKTQTKEKGYRSSLTFSFYNLYAHKNTFSVYYRRSVNNQQQAYRLAVIGTIIPAISYNFIF